MDTEFARRSEKHRQAKPEGRPTRRHRGLRPRNRHLLSGPWSPPARPEPLRKPLSRQVQALLLFGLSLALLGTLELWDAVDRTASPREDVASIERFALSLENQLPGPNFGALTCSAMKNFAPRLLAASSSLAHGSEQDRATAADLAAQAALWESGCDSLPDAELRARLQRVVATSRALLGAR